VLAKLIAATFVLLLFVSQGLGQSASLQGFVTDQNGAMVPSATVTATAENGSVKTVITDKTGFYSFRGLAHGSYTITASAASLMLKEPEIVSIKSGNQTLNLQLSVFLPDQKITVEDNAEARVSTETGNNASAQVLRGEDLDALGDSPEDLAEDLQRLAGPSAGPSGGQIFIDGFSGGQLPSKASIREIRINQNPFSPEYERLGFGRIEILTKPGSSKFAGAAYYNFCSSVLEFAQSLCAA